MNTRPKLLAFVHNRLDGMAQRPRMWAATQEAFILQVTLLVEVSHVGGTKTFDQQKLLSSLCGGSSTVPCGPIVEEWAYETIKLARLALCP